MSDGAVRVALRNFFQTPAIVGMPKVYLDQPTIIQGANWNVQVNLGWGAVGFVHLDTSHESRVTLGAAIGGSKQVNHTVGLVVQYQFLVPAAYPDGTDEDAWVTPFDSIIDAIKTRIRSDPTMGNSAVIFQGGQDQNDIRVTRDLPQDDVGRVVVFAVVEFDVTEILQA
ncbi:hypothetical protein [Cryobacterium sp. GrIS_2_6]|uniref:hypothetical protein n=1 Tax=Cryobacterium sp. GrIS_2_6 TaxID=3162785 RepID=UPI002DFE8D8C|nr:hypothetical protein [Cryobacterium psychrotolerans]MEC5149228.1 hypothetical protein [Cryobacterium psychrotolerans]MEC5149308.1 hypothetical protein [Cryobacterium psychrotolerans]